MAQPLGAPYSYFADSNGAPLAGGKVYTYAAGTTTPQNSYTDSSGTTPAPNPVVLDSAGRATIWLSGFYKIVVTDALGNTISTTDNITALNSTGDMSKSVYDPANIQEQLVGLTAVQTLTNKTLNNPTFTGTNVPFKTVKRQTFTASGTYTPSTGMIYCDVEIWGGGGGGGGVTAVSSAAAGGGGAGGYVRKVFPAVTIGASQAVTIGAGGTAGANTGGVGGTGGTSSLGSLIQATGGSGGSGVASASNSVAGGSGGVGSSGDINATGAPGAGSFSTGTLANSASGYGGSTSLGGGGTARNGSTSGQAAGAAGVANSGGGGSGGLAGAAAQVGGVGGTGYVVITEYCSQ